MGKTKLDETYKFKISDFFDVAIDIKIRFFRVLVTIEPGRSLLQFVTTNCLKSGILYFLSEGRSRMRVYLFVCIFYFFPGVIVSTQWS